MFENNKNAVLNLVLDLVEKQRIYKRLGHEYSKKTEGGYVFDEEIIFPMKDLMYRNCMDVDFNDRNLVSKKGSSSIGCSGLLEDKGIYKDVGIVGIDINNRYVHMLIAQFDELMEHTKQCLESLKVNIEQVYFYTLILLEMIIGADESLSMVCQNILNFLEDETVCLCDKAVILLGSSVQMFSQDNIINTIITLDSIKEKYTTSFKKSLHHESLYNKLLILDVIGKLCRAILFRDLYAGLRQVQMYV